MISKFHTSLISEPIRNQIKRTHVLLWLDQILILQTDWNTYNEIQYNV